MKSSIIFFLLSAFFRNNLAGAETDIYKYSAEVIAEVYQPVQYESSSKINGHLLIQCETDDNHLKSCIMTLKNITVSAYNGRSDNKNPVENTFDQSNGDIEKSFFVLYDKHGQFQGAKFANDDASWSKNVKLSIASGLQYNSILDEERRPNFSYFTDENTIHGNCRVSNDVKTKVNKDEEKVVSINKNYIPKYCGEYPKEYFDTNYDKCFRRISDENISSAKKTIEILVKGDSKKLINYEGDEIETYMPFLHKSDALILRIKQKLDYEGTIENQESNKSSFDDAPLVDDATYVKPTTYITDGGRDDITQGRRNFEKADSKKIIKMLKESYNYLNGNRFDKKDPNLSGGDNINKIAEYLVISDYKTLQKVWSELNSIEPSEEIEFMKKIFLDILAHVGTETSATFICDIIQSGNITDAVATDVLAQFPQYILEPGEKLLHDTKVLLNLDENVSHNIKKAAILSFASLIYRSCEDLTLETIPQITEEYLQYFNDKLKESIENNDMEMILVYIMAFQNIKVGHIERFLWPILRKDVEIKENSDRIRVAIALVIFAGIQADHELVHNVYFPIIIDENEYLPLRVISFLRLMYVTQVDSQRRPMEAYWEYINETNPELRNLHSSILASYANFSTPCRQTIREDYEKIIRFAEPEGFSFNLPSLRFSDNAINKYAFAEAMIEYIVKTNENTGLTDIGAYFWNIADSRKPGPFVQLYWMFERLDEIMLEGLKYFLKDQDIQSTLEKYQLEKSDNDATLTLIPFYGFQVAQVYHYDKRSPYEKKEQFWKQMKERMNCPTIFYSEFKEASAGSDLGVPGYFGHYEPNLLLKKVDIEATSEGSILNLNLKVQLDMWSHGTYDLSIYNSIADIFHTIRRSTAVDATVPMNIDAFYDLATKTLKIFAPVISDEKDLTPKLLTYSKTYTIMDGNDNFKDYEPIVAVTKGEDARQSYQSTFESNETKIKYNMDIYDCETGFNPDIDKEEWHEAIHNPDRLGPVVEELWAAKHKITVDMMSPRPGICGVLREYLPNDKYNPYLELKLGEN